MDPLPLANAAPREDDMTLWDAVIGVDIDGETTPLHFLIDFPANYPAAAPSIGFSFVFPYDQGASHTHRDGGRLNGTFVICLDLLGNYGSYHG